MQITLEEDLVTNSGREPGSSLFLSLLPSFFKAEPFGGCSSPCGVKPLLWYETSAQASAASTPLLLPKHCCPSLLSHELRPLTPAHKVTSPAPRAGGGFGQCRAQSGVRRALCAPTAIQQTRPEIPHWLYQHWTAPAGKGWATTSCWGDTLKIASIPEHQKCPAMNCKSLITVIL